MPDFPEDLDDETEIGDSLTVEIGSVLVGSNRSISLLGSSGKEIILIEIDLWQS